MKLVETHICDFPERTAFLSVIEEKDRIMIVFRWLLHKKTPSIDDRQLVRDWFRPIFKKYDSDRRPLYLDTTGRAKVFEKAFGNNALETIVMVSKKINK